MASDWAGFLSVSHSNTFFFNNSCNNDMMVYPETSNQRIIFGTTSNTSAVWVVNSNYAQVVGDFYIDSNIYLTKTPNLRGVRILPNQNQTNMNVTSTVSTIPGLSNETSSNGVALTGNYTKITGVTVVASNIIPLSNLVYDLGSSNFRFRSLYLASNTIDLGGTRLTVQNNGLAVTDSNNSNATLIVNQIQIGTSSNAVRLSLDAGNSIQFQSIALSNGVATSTSNATVGGWSNSGSNIFILGSNIGIGVSNPPYILSVASTTAVGPTPISSFFNSTLSNNNVAVVIGKALTTNNAGFINFTHSGTDGSANNLVTLGLWSAGQMSFTGAGKLGVGTSTPSNTVTVNGNASIGGSFINVIAPTNGLIVQGNVGIGTSNPSYNLDITGTMRCTTDMTVGGILYPQNIRLLNPALGTSGSYITMGNLNDNVNYFTQVGVSGGAAGIGFRFQTNSGSSPGSTILNINSSGISVNGVLTGATISNCPTSGGGAPFLTGAGPWTLIDSWGLMYTGTSFQPFHVSNASVSIGYNTSVSTNYGTGNLLVSGNVGIGTTAPTYKLSTAGRIATNDSVVVYGPNWAAWDHMSMYHDGNTAFLSAGGADSGLLIRVSSANSGDAGNQSYTNCIQCLANGTVGIGGISPAYTLDVNGTIHGSAIISDGGITMSNVGTEFAMKGWNGVSALQAAVPYGNGNYSSSATSNDVVFRTANRFHLQSGTGAAAITIGTNNYVGIATASPAYPLDVNGISRLNNTYTISSGGAFGLGTGNYVAVATIQSTYNISLAGCVQIKGNFGYINGSGTASFDIILGLTAYTGTAANFGTNAQINSTATVQTTVGTSFDVFLTRGTSNLTLWFVGTDWPTLNATISGPSGSIIIDPNWTNNKTSTAPSGQISLIKNATTIWQSNGNLGIGTTNPSVALDVVGQIRCTGSGSVGNVVLNAGSASTPGYISFVNNSGNRVGYIGWQSTVTNYFEMETENGYAGYRVTGNLIVAGSLSKGSGSFRIPHPVSSNKDLVHSFIEGPRADLIYRGKATLSNGTASINLNKQCTGNGSTMIDGTFEALCRDAQVFLQNNQTWDRLKGFVSGCTLNITCENTSASNEVEWMVVAERKDAAVVKWDLTDSNGRLILEHDRMETASSPPPP